MYRLTDHGYDIGEPLSSPAAITCAFFPAGSGRPVLLITSVVLQWNWGPCRGGESAKPQASQVLPLRDQTITLWIIIVVLAMILPIEALRNALVKAFNQITSNLNSIP